MPRLTDKYKPEHVHQFIGLDDAKRVLGKWLANPYPDAFLMVGESGVGKTAMCEAIARALNPENPFSPYTYIHTGSGKCDAAAVREIEHRLAYAPWGWWVLHIDEADQMTKAAQLAWLSILDRIPPSTVILFTCNETGSLERRFLSRCKNIKFSNYGLNGTGADYLRQVWEMERGPSDIAGGNSTAPNFERILKNSRNNLRDALNELEIL